MGPDAHDPGAEGPNPIKGFSGASAIAVRRRRLQRCDRVSNEYRVSPPTETFNRIVYAGSKWSPALQRLHKPCQLAGKYHKALYFNI